MLMPAAVIQIVMLHEHRRRQHDVGHRGSFGHELFVHRHKQILARKSVTDEILFGRDRHRIGVLDQHRLDRRAFLQRDRIAGQHAANF